MLPAIIERAFKLLAAAPVNGVFGGIWCLQGGVSAIAQLALKYLPQMPPIYGFDSFEGMPSTDAPLEGIYAPDWVEGTVSDTSLEVVQQRL